jgi:hypothetical protein
MDSILTSIKKLLGISEEETAFDTDIIIHINSVFMILTQMGVGPEEGFVILDEFAQWTDFIPEEGPNLELVKTYMYLKVRLLFDPPASSTVLASMERSISEFEWRLNVKAEMEADSEEE